jgi:hypothetical protein
MEDVSAEIINSDDENPNSVTLAKGEISLKPINPDHGEIFNGDLALKDIAEQGAAWRREHLRREDMEVSSPLFVSWRTCVVDEYSHRSTCSAYCWSGPVW